MNPNIFKAYDVRALYPSEIDEQTARRSGAGSSRISARRQIAVSRDMRLSSPSLADAFIAGALEQGADVVDCGLMATDMMYFAVASEGLQGGAQITASHNPPQYNGIKMVRQEALPLSGDAGLGEIRDMILHGTLPAPAATPGRRTSKDVLAPYVEHVFSFIDKRVDQAVQVRARCRQRHGRAGRAAAVRRAALPGHPDVHGDRRAASRTTKPTR